VQICRHEASPAPIWPAQAIAIGAHRHPISDKKKRTGKAVRRLT